MNTLFEQLKHCFNVSKARNLTPAARLTMLAILHCWNNSRRPGKFQVTDAELIALTGLAKQTVTESKRTLKNIGLIDFTARKSGTVYTLPSSQQKKAEHQATRVINYGQISNKKQDKKKEAYAREEDSTELHSRESDLLLL